MSWVGSASIESECSRRTPRRKSLLSAREVGRSSAASNFVPSPSPNPPRSRCLAPTFLRLGCYVAVGTECKEKRHVWSMQREERSKRRGRPIQPALVWRVYWRSGLRHRRACCALYAEPNVRKGSTATLGTGYQASDFHL